MGDSGDLAGGDAKVLEPGAGPAEDDEPPVVARLVVEIRSDGSRTVARGAMEDTRSGERVAIRAEGTTPMRLAIALARAMVKTPAMAAQAVRSLLPGRKG